MSDLSDFIGGAELVPKRETAGETVNPWRTAIIDAAVVGWTYRREHDHDPRAAVNALLCHAQDMALDPAISEPARVLHAEIAALRERCAALEAVLAPLACLMLGVPDPRFAGVRPADVRTLVMNGPREWSATPRPLTFEEARSVCDAALAAARAGAGGDTTAPTTEE